MGSQANQAQLWGRSVKDWSAIQEPTALAGYEFVLNALNLKGQETLLDIGCGSGLFCTLAAPKVRFITGFDATVELVEEARHRLPAYPFLVGEMEELPLPDEAYDIVTGFNSFQYAANIANAFAEARRVLKPGGHLVAMIWGNKEDCEAAVSLGAIGKVLPPPTPASGAESLPQAMPGAPGPFALSENHLLEKSLESAGFTIRQSTDVTSVWDYPDTATLLRGFLSSGPAVKAIAYAGYDAVAAAVTATLQPFTQPNGHVVYHNKFRVVIATK